VAFVTPPFSVPHLDTLLALNNAHAEELSFMTAEAFHGLLAAAHVALAEESGLALLVAFRDDSTYDNPNFHWLKLRYHSFLYIDRVVVSEEARGRGLARQLYEALEARAAEEARGRMVCEINLEPQNLPSEKFHETLGFRPVGSQVLADAKKTVRYWSKELIGKNVHQHLS
jgi:predicted GNAT superfamily acetyltransferase